MKQNMSFKYCFLVGPRISVEWGENRMEDRGKQGNGFLRVEFMQILDFMPNDFFPIQWGNESEITVTYQVYILNESCSFRTQCIIYSCKCNIRSNKTLGLVFCGNAYFLFGNMTSIPSIQLINDDIKNYPYIQFLKISYENKFSIRQHT